MKEKLITFTVISITLVVSIILFTTYVTVNMQNENTISQLRTLLYNDYDMLIKSQVNSVVSLCENYVKISEEKGITDEKIKQGLADIIRDLRYSESGYFWIDTKEGVNVVLLGKKDTEGKSRIEFQDVKGMYIIKELIMAAESKDGGFVDYYFPKPNEEEASHKRGYAKSFDKYNWVIGTGNYVDDLEEVIAVEKQSMQGSLIKSLTGILIIALVILLTALWVAYIMAKKYQILLIKLRK